MPKRSVLVLAAILALCSLQASGKSKEQQAMKPSLSGAALAEALKGGGYVILMRHQATEPVAPDPAFFDIADCETQRNLSEQGRQDAKQIGAAFQTLGIRVSEVLTSPYCRCVESGELTFGKAQPSDLLSVFDRLDSLAKDERGAEIRKLLATPPAEAGSNTVLITHTGTLLYSFGLDTRPEGISHVFKPGPVPGLSQYVGRVEPAEWSALAAGTTP